MGREHYSGNKNYLDNAENSEKYVSLCNTYNTTMLENSFEAHFSESTITFYNTLSTGGVYSLN